MPDDTAEAADPAGEDPVGYARPPRHGRFQPGRSGNPKGRPKGRRNLTTLVQAELKRPVTVTEGGRTRRVEKAAAMVASQVNKALKGDTRAFVTVLQATRPHPGAAAGAADAMEKDLAEAEAAHHLLVARLERIARQHASSRERMAGDLAAAGVAPEHLDLLFGPRGDQLQDRLSAALLAVQARGFDIREAAELSVLDAAEDCAEALLGEDRGG